MIKLILLYLILLVSLLTASDLTITINVAGNSVGTLYLCLVNNEIDFNFIKLLIKMIFFLGDTLHQ